MNPVLARACTCARRPRHPTRLPREDGMDQRHRWDRAVAMGATSLTTPRASVILASPPWNIKGNVKDMRDGWIVKPAQEVAGGVRPPLPAGGAPPGAPAAPGGRGGVSAFPDPRRGPRGAPGGGPRPCRAPAP